MNKRKINIPNKKLIFVKIVVFNFSAYNQRRVNLNPPSGGRYAERRNSSSGGTVMDHRRSGAIFIAQPFHYSANVAAGAIARDSPWTSMAIFRDGHQELGSKKSNKKIAEIWVFLKFVKNSFRAYNKHDRTTKFYFGREPLADQRRDFALSDLSLLSWIKSRPNYSSFSSPGTQLTHNEGSRAKITNELFLAREKLEKNGTSSNQFWPWPFL